MKSLKKTERKREYAAYPSSVRGHVAFEWLVNPKSTHRFIDYKIIGLDPIYSRGYQSMGILHFQGLVKDHHGVFHDYEFNDIITEIAKTKGSECLLDDLDKYVNNQTINEKEFHKSFQRQVHSSVNDSCISRRNRIGQYSGIAEQVVVISYRYIRNPDITAEALVRANGICEDCRMPAPFLRKSDSTPYLEVHHKIPLSEDGKDDLSNVLVLCPNCHRKRHFGPKDV